MVDNPSRHRARRSHDELAARPTDCTTARDGAEDQWDGGARAGTVGGEPMGGAWECARSGPKINTLYGRIIGNEERKDGKKEEEMELEGEGHRRRILVLPPD